MARSSAAREPVQGEVEKQHVDARFPKQPKHSTLRLLLDQGPDSLRG